MTIDKNSKESMNKDLMTENSKYMRSSIESDVNSLILDLFKHRELLKRYSGRNLSNILKSNEYMIKELEDY